MGWVHGELYQLRDDELIGALDVYEGCGLSDPEPHLFERVVTEVLLEGGRRVPSWIYVYKGSTEGRPVIESGEWPRAR